MILKASQRAGGLQLAYHLMNVSDNDHVEIHDLRGFIGETLDAAFVEAYAVSRGTKCRQFLFSLSLSPPETEIVPVDVFEKAIEKIETKIGLAGQPRAIVFHEKEGRRHAHCVWSRIDTDTMTAINLPHFKRKLCDISRELYLEHNWQMPRGLMNAAERDPLNFTLAEWQQAKRVKQDPRVIKHIFQSCWNQSDSVSAFAAALKERGFFLAKGDKRGHVAVDWRGEVYAVSKWVGVKAKEVRARFGDANVLASVDETKVEITSQMTDKLHGFVGVAESQNQSRQESLEKRRIYMIDRHRADRDQLRQVQAKRKTEETRVRAHKLPTGLKALWFRVTGKYRKIVYENEIDTQRCDVRDRVERQHKIESQILERGVLQREIMQLRINHAVAAKSLDQEVREFINSNGQERPSNIRNRRSLDAKKRRRRDRSP
jgi:hypothetical protein